MSGDASPPAAAARRRSCHLSWKRRHYSNCGLVSSLSVFPPVRLFRVWLVQQGLRYMSRDVSGDLAVYVCRRLPRTSVIEVRVEARPH
ncbi:unnamed protein product [Danaus chrysippus]|uniref:(African queen) hypothetical protein n=1 Tax=Danaus chrysippus TaxID=151541 RepID=A0A8J2VRS9_9NEOP|nr:unnamed protein product [Danaus chrysippus]